MNEKLKERLKAIGPKVGFPIFYLFCLVLFARWTLPWDKVRDRAVLTFDEQQRATGGQQELKIDELGPSWFSVKAKGVRLLGPPPEPGKPPSETKIDEVSASLLSLAFGTYDLHIDAFGGTIKVAYSDSSKERNIDLALDDVNLGQIDAVKESLGIPVEGTIGGTIKLTMPEAKASKAVGSVSLDANDVAIGDGKAKIKGPMPLAVPRLAIGAITIAGEAKDGVLKITKLSAGGKDLDLQGEGRVQLRDNLGESLADLSLRFKISDAYKGKNDTTKSLFGAPGSSVPGVIDLDPKMKQAKRPDGFYSLQMRGTLSHPDFVPGAGGAPPGAPLAPMPKVMP